METVQVPFRLIVRYRWCRVPEIHSHWALHGLRDSRFPDELSPCRRPVTDLWTIRCPSKVRSTPSLEAGESCNCPAAPVVWHIRSRCDPTWYCKAWVLT